MKRNKKVLAGVAICAVLAIVGTVFMGMTAGNTQEESEEAFSPVTIVETTTPHIDSIVVTSSLVGTVEPGQQVTVYPKAAGEVVTANFGVGEAVQAGDVLFVIDSTALQLDLAQQQASLASAQAKANFNVEVAEQNLETAQSNNEDDLNSQLLSAASAVENAEVAVEQARTNLTSAQLSATTARRDLTDLREGRKESSDFSETMTYDDVLRQLQQASMQADIAVQGAELSVENAEMALEQAKANQRAIQKQVEETEIATENQVTTARLNADFSDQYIAIQKLETTLADYTVTAPISGVIEQKNIDVYDNTSTQSPAYIISNKDITTVSFMVSESALEHVEIGDDITVDKDGQTCLGAVSEISTMADSATGLYQVKATVSGAPFEMRSNSSVKVYVDTQKAENELLLPIDAVYYDNGTPYVYLFEDNTARRVEIETGISDNEYIHVKSGLSRTDDVIVTWSASLTDGSEVYLPGTAPEEEKQNVSHVIDDAADGMESGDDTTLLVEEAAE